MLVFSVVIYAQEQRTCGMVEHMNEKLADPVFAKQHAITQSKLRKQVQYRLGNNSQQSLVPVVIPVAVHFPAGNESDRACLEALAQNQVDILNADYSATNADITNWTAASAFYPDSNTGAANIFFCLATTNHPAGTDAEVLEGNPAVTIGYNFGGGNDADTNFSGYMNFLVKDAGNGILGYSPLGGSIAAGQSVVISPAAFGSGTGCTGYQAGAPYNLGRTVTHELGHFFTLNHTFNGGCAGNNDGHADTPATSDPTYGCPGDGTVDGCVSGEKALTMNYMDYTNDACMYMFTESQQTAVEVYIASVQADFRPNAVACSGINDYILSFVDTSVDVCQPNNAIFTFEYDADDAFTDAVTFTATGNPAGTTVAFSQNNVTADVAAITVTVSGITTAGTDTIVVTGTYGSEVQNYNLTLNVSDNTLVAPTLLTPTDGATAVTVYDLTWTADASAISYDVEIATDLGFTNIVQGPISVVTNQYSAIGLSPLTQYYWRVRTINACLTTPYTTPFSFTTGECTLCTSVANTEWATSTTRVVFNTIDNASGKPSGYSDYTAISTDVLINNSYDLTVNANTDGNYTTKTIVWIDWNQNCVFDVPSEEYDLGDAVNQTDGPTDLSALSITVPTGAILGNTIMRVTTKFKSDGLQTSCENDADAEVEDYTINVTAPLPDADSDGIPDVDDNCVNTPNTDQADWNMNGIGDVCEDSDGDTIMDDIDNCVSIANTDQADADSNGQGDVCQDTDNDGVFDTVDNCINTPNPGQEDWNNNGTGDVCDDTDGDTIMDDVDNCVSTANTDQADMNNDGEGDVCDDTDGDGINDDIDNCPTVANFDQADTDNDGTGDVCQDTDNDGVLDTIDNCINTPNPGQEDWNNNGTGDVCEDSDGDTIMDDVDNCVSTANTDQADWDNDGEGDVCDDTDGDTIMDDIDNCVTTANTDQADVENDGIGDACQVYDADNDGVLDDVDNCVNTANPGQEDADENGIGDVCQDTDLDGVLDINDNCSTVANTDQTDIDGNGVGDACQDTDSDGVLDIEDNCPLTANPGQEDENNDGIGDVCESLEPADTLTPNGDLLNDTWDIKNIENVSNTVKVFNRHGVKVFDASNYVNKTWGGESTEGGSGLLPAGSYYYVINYVSTQGEAKVVTGWMYINY